MRIDSHPQSRSYDAQHLWLVWGLPTVTWTVLPVGHTPMHADLTEWYNLCTGVYYRHGVPESLSVKPVQTQSALVALHAQYKDGYVASGYRNDFCKIINRRPYVKITAKYPLSVITLNDAQRVLLSSEKELRCLLLEECRVFVSESGAEIFIHEDTGELIVELLPERVTLDGVDDDDGFRYLPLLDAQQLHLFERYPE